MVNSNLVLDFSLQSLLSIAAVVLAFFLYVWTKLKLARTMSKLAHKSNWETLFVGFRPRLAFFKTVLVFTACLFLGFAFLRPKWGKLPQEITQEVRNVIFALDMSRSMLARDLSPNRLDFIKHKLRSLIEQLGPERVALLLFADKAFVHCPFTNDFNAFFSFLDQANNEVISSGGTSITQALYGAIRVFKKLPTLGNSKIVFLITDGEDFSSDIDTAINASKEAGLSVFTIGAATLQGAPVPILDHKGKSVGFEKDASGKPIISKLNEDFLKQLAGKLQGEYVRATGSGADIDFILQKIESFEKEKMLGRQANVLIERHNIFAAFFWILMLLEWFL